VQDYTEEFYRLNIRAGHIEDDAEKISRYINGLHYSIQDEISMVRITSIEEAYQFSLKAEEKISRRQNSSRGRGKSSKGRGQSNPGRGSQDKQGETSSQTNTQGGRGRGDYS